MLQVIDVIDEQPNQSDFGSAPDPASRKLTLLRHALGDVEQMSVVRPSQVDQIRPSGRLVALVIFALFRAKWLSDRR
jgi:hypothetical protein